MQILTVLARMEAAVGFGESLTRQIARRAPEASGLSKVILIGPVTSSIINRDSGIAPPLYTIPIFAQRCEERKLVIESPACVAEKARS